MARKFKILFLCTANACRSQMAEALLRHVGGDRFEACSAGAHAVGYIHPLATSAMASLNIPMDGQYSKSWDEFADVPLDAVITLCDSAAKESCPVWPGAPIVVHWPLSDPVGVDGTAEHREEYARLLATRLRARMERLVELDFEEANSAELKRRLENLREL
jgi:arsenate reductase (thioredoxin)